MKPKACTNRVVEHAKLYRNTSAIMDALIEGHAEIKKCSTTT
jgi:hypothetical protein